MKKPAPNYKRDYFCSGCSQTGVKLWRDYNTCANAVELNCAECASAMEKPQRPDGYPHLGPVLDADGYYTFADGTGQVGGLAAAVPTEEGDTFWGLSSTPGPSWRWWHALPTYNDDARERRCLTNLATSFGKTGGFRVRDSLKEAMIANVLRFRRGVERNPIPTYAKIPTANEIKNAPTTAALRDLMLRALDIWQSASTAYMAAIEDRTEQGWHLDRVLYRPTKAIKLHIFDTVREKVKDDLWVSYGKEIEREITPEARIAVRTFPNGNVSIDLINLKHDTLKATRSIMKEYTFADDSKSLCRVEADWISDMLKAGDIVAIQRTKPRSSRKEIP